MATEDFGPGAGAAPADDDLVLAAEAVGRLARDEDTFRAAIDAWRRADGETFAAVLDRWDLRPRCELICRWISAKECVLICAWLAGPPDPAADLPDPREFAEVVTRVIGDDESLDLLVKAVEGRDRDAWASLIERHDIARFRHLLCHWACTVRSRLICQVVCSPLVTRPLRLADELRRAGEAVTKLAGDKAAFAAAVAAVQQADPVGLREAVGAAGLLARCYFVCEWFCSWRCIRVCFRLAREFPFEIDDPDREMWDFAQVVGRLADDPQTLGRLSASVERGDGKLFARLVRELGLERFAVQLCHWFCYRLCRLFCRLVCPVPDPALFTHVGDFHIHADIDPATGLTSHGVLGHAGADFGFFGGLELRGFCPKTSPSVPGAQMRYRFLYLKPGGGFDPLVGSLLRPVNVGNRLIGWDVQGTGVQSTFQTVQVAGAGATPQITPPPSPLPPPGTPWGGPPPHVIVPDADGWITVDPDTVGGFFTLIKFDTGVAFAGGAANPGVTAGAAVPAGNQRNGVVSRLVFEATRVGATGAPDFSNELHRILISNWDQVDLLDLVQFHSAGGTPCSPLSTDLDIEYTADHQLMAEWSVTVTSAALPTAVAGPGGTTPRGGAGTDHHDITSWASCSYTVSLTTRRALTTGVTDDPGRTVSRTFCK